MSLPSQAPRRRSLLSSKRQRLLVTVLTYPHPSSKHQETVCTAGIDDQGRWVRLYPLPLRSMPPERQIRKWQWIELDTLPPTNDQRPESRRPEWDSIQIVSYLDSQKDREVRREWVNKLPVRSLAGWEATYEVDKTSLGVLVPRRVLGIEHEREADDWTEEEKAKLSQMNLFADTPKRLEKIPYRFRYVVEDEDGKERKLSIRDWELGELYRRMRDQHGPDEAINKVKQKYLDKMCAPDKDTRFFVGTMYPYNQWMVVGVFWPPKTKDDLAGQASLFGGTE
jgi:hypothetical protein